MQVKRFKDTLSLDSGKQGRQQVLSAVDLYLECEKNLIKAKAKYDNDNNKMEVEFPKEFS